MNNRNSFIPKIKAMIRRAILAICNAIVTYAGIYRHEQMNEKYRLHPSVRVHGVELVGNIEIGANTYINQGSTLSTGEFSTIKVGKYCAIGRYVHISAKTHTFSLPTADEFHAIHNHNEKDVVIGNYVWIGDKAFIKEGVKIADYAIIAANSVVVRDVAEFEIVGGVPAKHIRFNTEHYRYTEL